MTEFYTRSDGKTKVRIADMAIHHAEPALAKLLREREDDSRDAEIATLSAHVASLTEEALEAGVSE